MNLLSLFSGIGSFEKALENIGINYGLVGFSEIDKWAVESYCNIHNAEKELNLGDIREISGEDVEKDVDMIVHGSPCQSFSIAGEQDGGDKGSDTESSLMWETVRLIRELNPKYIIWENVKNVLSKNHIHNFDAYKKELTSKGYNNYWKVLNAKDYSIPQNRERVFVVSLREDIDTGEFKFPDKIELQLTLGDMLNDIVEDKYILPEERQKTISLFEDKKYYDNRIHHIGNLEWKGMGFQNKRIYGRDGIAATLNTMQGGGKPLMYKNGRVREMTPLECWRLMGFTDEDYWSSRKRLEEVFYNGRDRSNSQMYKQAGNSIVVPVLEALFKELLLVDKKTEEKTEKDEGLNKEKIAI